jgi:hypothetical protein
LFAERLEDHRPFELPLAIPLLRLLLRGDLLGGQRDGLWQVIFRKVIRHSKLRFAEAEAQVQDLMMRWFAVKETRVVECDDPVNYRYVGGRLDQVGAAAVSVAEAPSGAPSLS